MNGAEGLIGSLVASGVEVCFSNPGTSEIHLVAALDNVPEMRCLLALFEGVATGAADGYARMAGKPACTLLHLGPGLSNGSANLHNAKRARTPIVNLIGQHPAGHLQYDTPLTSDIESIARPYSDWVRTSSHSTEVGRDAAEAVAAARTAPGQIATLIVPADVAWGESASTSPSLQVPPSPLPGTRAIEAAAAALREDAPSAILLDGNALYGRGLIAAGRIAAATGATLLAPYPLARMQRGAGLPKVERIHYVLEQGVEQLKHFQNLILVGARVPVAYFAYPGKNSALTSCACRIHTLARPGEDYIGALDELAAVLSLGGADLATKKAQRPSLPTGELTTSNIAAVVGALLPENAIVIDESMTSGRGLMAATAGASPHDWLGNTGGSIGIALPLAVGAAVACPNRRVVCLTADGSAMYTLQALWTMARENLRITTVVFANRSYAVLKREFSYLGIGDPGPRAAAMFDIDGPPIRFAELAKAMGVDGVCVNTLPAFVKALRRSLKEDEPTLIEVQL